MRPIGPPVVVSLTNEDGLLLPGMTTTVDFLIERAQDVFKVPNAALRFRPSTEMMAEFRKQMEEQGAEGGQAWGQGREGATNGEQAGTRGGGEAGGANRAWGGGGEAGRGNRTWAGGEAGGFGGFGGGMGGGRPRDVARLWYLDGEGKLRMLRVRTGITDGQMTEVRSDELTEGQEVISALLTTDAPRATPIFPGATPGPPPGGRRGMGGPF